MASFKLSILLTSTENFTQVGDTRLLLVADELSYDDAKANCAQMNSTLVEFWNGEEWDKVGMLAPRLGQQLNLKINIHGEMCVWITDHFVVE